MSDHDPTRSAPPTPDAPPHPRVRISCPGCGRNDYVTWPRERAIYHWTCFNCGKSFDLTRDGGH